ncbi:MAG: ribosomal-processing cysteine protease Prp [Liquorilactobacillus hordei]|uniref:ribosomal-processing cysteine protease Prp n=1 Tax=Liquorilactobacillus hordei TaxID=468911 RepID=UPI0039EBA105
MIQVELINSHSEDYKMIIRSKGHAGYAKKGNDIVCAAVSVLLEHTMQNLTSVRVSDDGVNYSATIFNVDEGDKRLIRALGNTLASIANQYPNNLKLIATR